MNNRKKIKTLKRIIKQYQERDEHVHKFVCSKVITDEQLQEVLKGGKPAKKLTADLMIKLSNQLISMDYVNIFIKPCEELENHNHAYVELKVLRKGDED